MEKILEQIEKSKKFQALMSLMITVPELVNCYILRHMVAAVAVMCMIHRNMQDTSNLCYGWGIILTVLLLMIFPKFNLLVIHIALWKPVIEAGYFENLFPHYIGCSIGAALISVVSVVAVRSRAKRLGEVKKDNFKRQIVKIVGLACFYTTLVINCTIVGLGC